MVSEFNKQKNIDIAGNYNTNDFNHTMIQIQQDVEEGVDILSRSDTDIRKLFKNQLLH